MCKSCGHNLTGGDARPGVQVSIRGLGVTGPLESTKIPLHLYMSIGTARFVLTMHIDGAEEMAAWITELAVQS